MIPATPPPVPAPSPAPAPTAQKSALPQAQAARSSAGETTAANIRAETTRAIDAPDQSAVAPRLRDQETRERPAPVLEELVGPEPTFEESPLERQARVALDPPEPTEPPVAIDPEATGQTAAPDEADASEITVQEPTVFEDPPPTPTERAEVSFAETRTIADKSEPATIDVAR